VRERRGSGGARYAAIYPALHAGSYTLWRPDGQPALEVTITGGAVAAVLLRKRNGPENPPAA